MPNITKEALLMVFLRRQHVEDFHYACEFNCDDLEHDYLSWIDISATHNDYFAILHNFCENYLDNAATSWRRRTLGTMRRLQLGRANGMCGGLHLLVDQSLLSPVSLK
jgi:hypothetical protein